jgi:hypothetical protein
MALNMLIFYWRICLFGFWFRHITLCVNSTFVGYSCVAMVWTWYPISTINIHSQLNDLVYRTLSPASSCSYFLSVYSFQDHLQIVLVANIPFLSRHIHYTLFIQNNTYPKPLYKMIWIELHCSINGNAIPVQNSVPHGYAISSSTRHWTFHLLGQ